jgi:hypothetical protein
MKEQTFGGASPHRAEPHHSDSGPITVVLRPVQFYDIWNRSRSVTGERLLALAMIEQASDDLRHYRDGRGRRARRLYREAFDWVASGSREWPYSFASLCDALDLSPSLLRKQLLNPNGGTLDAAA